MALRSHSVIVQPDRWSGPTTELARLLAPVTGSDVSPLAALLDRGPMTVETDLSAADAEALAARLSSLGVPAEIQPPTDSAPPRLAPAPPERQTDEIPRTRHGTIVGGRPMTQPDEAEAGWGALFPDLAGPQPAPPGPPGLDELEGAATASPARRPAETPILGSAPVGAATELTPPLRRDVALPTVEAPTPRRPITPTGFEAEKLAALLPEDPSDGARPPYKPTGFDPRPEHHPPFAVAFALAAPGAGHVFNGDDDEAISIGLRFWLLKPWIDSVREAGRRAEQIRTYHAPRPAEGSGVRALKYAAAWWLCLALVIAAVSWGVDVASKLANRQPEVEGLTAAQIGSAFSSAETGVLGARVAALDALKVASEELVAQPKYTMTEAERAERLFAIGYFECQRRSYVMCEALMKRVLELKPAFGPAIKLQAWSSAARNGGLGPFPDVGEVKSLSELELNEMRHEMVLQGEHVPPPPEPTAQAKTGTPQEEAP